MYVVENVALRGCCRYDFLKVHNPYRWLPDAHESDVHDKKTGGTEPRKNFLKSDVRSLASCVDLLCISITVQVHHAGLLLQIT